MRQTRSASLKMSLKTAPADRRISKFPQPFLPSCSHPARNFDDHVRKTCEQPPVIPGLTICKTVFLGDVAVGKTSLVNRYCHQEFDSNYKATIGVDFEIERFDILRIPFNLQIWDTAGQERFRSIATSYYRGAHVVVVVFDLTNALSLSHCLRWFQDALEANPLEGVLKFLVGTKLDMVSQITYAEMERRALKLAKEKSAEYWAVSSRTGENVDQFFTRLAALAFNQCILAENLSQKFKKITIGDCLSCGERNKKNNQETTRCKGCSN